MRIRTYACLLLLAAASTGCHDDKSDVSIGPISFKPGPFPNYYFTDALIKDTGKEPLFIRLVVTAYDRDGKVIGIQENYKNIYPDLPAHLDASINDLAGRPAKMKAELKEATRQK